MSSLHDVANCHVLKLRQRGPGYDPVTATHISFGSELRRTTKFVGVNTKVVSNALKRFD